MYEICNFNKIEKKQTNNELSYQKSFHRAGLSLIIDLFDTDGEFLSQETLKHFNVNMNL